MIFRPPRVLAVFVVLLYALLLAWYFHSRGELFFILSKILAFSLMPLTWIFILFLWCWKTKIIKRKKRLFWTALAALYFFTNSFLADEFMRLWEVRYHREDFAPEQEQDFDYAIVLGGMTWYNPKLKKPQFQRGADRLLQALWLLQQKKVKKIIFTGGSGSIEHPDYKEGIIIARWLSQMGFPDSSFVFETESRNTRENAVFTKRILEKMDYRNKKILLVTSAFHMRRAMACFKKAGVENLIPYITDGYSGPRKFGIDHCFIPSSDALQVYNLLIHEITGYITYRIIGYC